MVDVKSKDLAIVCICHSMEEKRGLANLKKRDPKEEESNNHAINGGMKNKIWQMQFF